MQMFHHSTRLLQSFSQTVLDLRPHGLKPATRLAGWADGGEGSLPLPTQHGPEARQKTTLAQEDRTGSLGVQGRMGMSTSYDLLDLS